MGVHGSIDNPRPGLTTQCAVHYSGSLTTGKVFDSSYNSLWGFPAMFAPSGVIKGWTEAMQLMREGDKWELVFIIEIVKVFPGSTARQYPASQLLENPVLGPIPWLGFHVIRMWHIIVVYLLWCLKDWLVPAAAAPADTPKRD